MNKSSTYLTQFQLFTLLIQTQVGLGILSLPYDLFMISKTDGWISLLIAGFFVQFLITLYFILLRKESNSNIFDISHSLLGKYIGHLITFGYLLYFIFVSIIILTIFSNFIDTWLLKLTPRWVILLPFVLLSLYLVRESLILIARFYVIVTLLIVLFIPLVLVAFTNFHFDYLFPIGQTGMKKIFEGSLEATISLLGYEILLFIFPFIERKKNNKKNIDVQKTYKLVSLANVLIIFLYLFIVVICFTFFSPDEIVLVPMPVLYMLKAFTSTVVDRIDLIFIPIWCIAIMTSFMSYLYLSSLSLAKLFRKKNHKNMVIWVAIIIYLISIFFHNNLSINHLAKMLRNISFMFIGIIPILLLLIYYIQQKWRENN